MKSSASVQRLITVAAYERSVWHLNATSIALIVFSATEPAFP